MTSRLPAMLVLLAATVMATMVYTPLHAQPLKIGVTGKSVDSCLSKWKVVPSDMESGDSVCLGATFWDLEGHLLFHIDSVEHTLTKVDWSTYMPVGRTEADTIAKQIETALGPCERARNHDWVYWIWDNDEIHYSLGYSTGTLRLLEFQDEGGLNACMLH
ncbi:MAG TPA: hypothetical protein VGM92_00335 [Candidatus Kapabacteria bacterium]